ncbi:hypothetical protein H6P81_015061 [Aristolochia fimbriata]|uniref:Uncharacterized protein n=1 Tax=Aristolochia fimbriata TaxID=158543 RepID=A0AAV7E5P8_ARIFI|nr:hypothetical protein H6P81_015061 [Aristolochia fimbriata]
MRFPFLGLESPLRLAGLFRQVEQDIETVIHVLNPGPVGILEHKFSSAEISTAKAAVNRAVENWRRNSQLERRNPVLNDAQETTR